MKRKKEFVNETAEVWKLTAAFTYGFSWSCGFLVISKTVCCKTRCKKPSHSATQPPFHTWHLSDILTETLTATLYNKLSYTLTVYNCSFVPIGETKMTNFLKVKIIFQSFSYYSQKIIDNFKIFWILSRKDRMKMSSEWNCSEYLLLMK